MILIYGDSLVEYYPTDSTQVLNEGHAGETTLDLLDRLPEVLEHECETFLFWAGTNDLSEDYQRQPEEIVHTIKEILDRVHMKWPHCVLYVLSLIPCHHEKRDVFTIRRGIRTNERIQEINKLLSQLPYPMISFYEYMDSHPEYYVDSLHINQEAYQYITRIIKGSI